MSEDIKEESWATQGSVEFLTNRDELLRAYDREKEKNVDRPIKLSHGNVGEADFRQWLSTFLPKRFGVTSGYIISQGRQAGNKLHHFDVIIYDQIEAPVLWVQGSSDQSENGKRKAIPAEYVLCVIEVKSTFSKENVCDAIAQLRKLEPLMKGQNQGDSTYPEYLPSNFRCMVVFFEIRKKEAKSISALEELVAETSLRGFVGGIILRGEGAPANSSGRIYFLEMHRSHSHYDAIFERLDDQHGMIGVLSSTGVVSTTGEISRHGFINWGDFCFAQFAHDLVAICRGRFKVGRLSSWHGLDFRANNTEN